MAAAARFDTLDYACKLEAAGVPKVQAELQARALREALARYERSGSDCSASRRLDRGVDFALWMCLLLIFIDANILIRALLEH